MGPLVSLGWLALGVALAASPAKADRKLAATFEQWDTDPNKFNTSEGD